MELLFNLDDLPKKFIFEEDKLVNDKGTQANIYQVAPNLVVKIWKEKNNLLRNMRSIFRSKKEYEFTKDLYSKKRKLPKPEGVFRVFNDEEGRFYPGYVMEYWGKGKAKTKKELGEKGLKIDSELLIKLGNKELGLIKEQGYYSIDCGWEENWLYLNGDICIIDVCRWRYCGKNSELLKWNSFIDYCSLVK